jgi:hypothetical protein
MEVSSQERSIKQGRRYPKDVKSRMKPRSRENECGVRIEGWSEVEGLLVKKDHEVGVGVGDRGGDCWKENAKTLNLDNFGGLPGTGVFRGVPVAGWQAYESNRGALQTPTARTAAAP